MALINQINCTTFTGNSGFGRCFYEPSEREYAIVVPKGWIGTAANLASFVSYLQSMLINDNPVLRFQAFGKFEDWTDQSEAVKFFTFASGRKLVSSDATEQTLFRMFDGGLCNQKNALDFDGCHTGKEVIYVDKKFKVQFMLTTDTSNLPAVKGFPMDMFYVEKFKQPTPSAPAEYGIIIEHVAAKQMQKDMCIVDLNTSFAPLRLNYSMQNAYLSNVTPGGAASGVFHVQIMGGCGNDNLVTLFGSLWSNIARFTAKNHVTQAAITISSVGLNTAGTAVVITLSTGDSDYPTPPALIDIALVAPSVLGAIGIKWYEGVIPLLNSLGNASTTGQLEVAAS